VLVNGAAVAPAEGFLAMTGAACEQALLVNVRAVGLAEGTARIPLGRRKAPRRWPRWSCGWRQRPPSP
jgi:hypothetical protein